MTERRITKRVVDGLKPQAREFAVWDCKLPGFGVRVRPTGAMSYIVVYRAGSGRGAPVRRYTIANVGKATAEAARGRAKAILGAVAHGQDPAGEKATERGTLTVSALSDRFMSEHVEQKRKPGTAVFYRHLLDKVICPQLRATKADKLTRAQVARLHGSLRQTPFQANRVLAVIGSMSASLIGHSGSSAFRLSTTTVSMSLTGSCFSSESAPGALPSWDSRTRRNDLSGGLAVRRTVGPSGHANSPHPSSREGHHSTARWRLECPYGIRCCTVFMLLLLLWPVLGSSGTRCRQPICGA